MNTGIQDAVALGHALSAVLGGRADESRLDEYEQTRRPVAERVVAFTDRMTRMATLRSPRARRCATPRSGVIGRIPASRQSLAMELSGLRMKAGPRRTRWDARVGLSGGTVSQRRPEIGGSSHGVSARASRRARIGELSIVRNPARQPAGRSRAASRSSGAAVAFLGGVFFLARRPVPLPRGPRRPRRRRAAGASGNRSGGSSGLGALRNTSAGLPSRGRRRVRGPAEARRGTDARGDALRPGRGGEHDAGAPALAQRSLGAGARLVRRGRGERTVLAAAFDGLNRYLGNFVGEFVGELALSIFFVLSGVGLLRHERAPRWLGGWGIATGVLGPIGLWRNVTPAVNIGRGSQQLPAAGVDDRLRRLAHGRGAPGPSRRIAPVTSESAVPRMLKLAIPLLHVSDSMQAEEFYCSRLGFRRQFAFRLDDSRADPCYLGLSRDGVPSTCRPSRATAFPAESQLSSSTTWMRSIPSSLRRTFRSRWRRRIRPGAPGRCTSGTPTETCSGSSARDKAETLTGQPSRDHSGRRNRHGSRLVHPALPGRHLLHRTRRADDHGTVPGLAGRRSALERGRRRDARRLGDRRRGRLAPELEAPRLTRTVEEIRLSRCSARTSISTYNPRNGGAPDSRGVAGDRAAARGGPGRRRRGSRRRGRRGPRRRSGVGGAASRRTRRGAEGLARRESSTTLTRSRARSSPRAESRATRRRLSRSSTCASSSASLPGRRGARSPRRRATRFSSSRRRRFSNGRRSASSA